jgi:hypothetical protein
VILPCLARLELLGGLASVMPPESISGEPGQFPRAPRLAVLVSPPPRSARHTPMANLLCLNPASVTGCHALRPGIQEFDLPRLWDDVRLGEEA